MKYTKTMIIFFLVFFLGGCPSGPPPKKKKQTAEIPRRGKWSSLVLNTSIKVRIVFLRELFEGADFKFSDTFQMEGGARLSYNSYLDLLSYPRDSKGIFQKTFGSEKTRDLAGVLDRPQIWQEVEILFQNILLVEQFTQVISLQQKLRDPQAPWQLYKNALEMGIAFLQKVETDGYLKWLTVRLHQVLKKLEANLEDPKLPATKKAQLAWLNVNFARVEKENPKRALAILVHRRNLLGQNRNISWLKTMANLKNIRKKTRSMILSSPSNLETRTPYSGREPQFMDTNQGKRYQGISWLATDDRGGVYFSDYENIYRLEKNSRAQLVVEGARGFFHPNVFVLRPPYLYFIDPPYFREINLSKRTIQNYLFTKSIPQIKKRSYLGLYPFAIDRTGKIYFPDNQQKILFVLQPNHFTKNLDIRGDYPFQGSISSLVYHEKKIYATDYENHRVLQLDLPLKEWQTLAGQKMVYGHRDGNKDGSLMNHPFALALYQTSLFVSDEANFALRKIRGGRVATVVGFHRGILDGPLARAKINLPGPLAIDKKGVVFFVEQSTGAIRVIAPPGWVYKGSTMPIFKKIARPLGKARALLARKKYQEAANVLEGALKVTPLGLSLWRALKMRGHLFFEMGFYPKSIEDFSRCIALNPFLPEGYLLRGKAYSASGEPQKARGDFERVISEKNYLPLQKKCQNTLYLKARMGNVKTYSTEGKYEKALRQASSFFSFLKSANTTYNISTKKWEMIVLRERARIYKKMGKTQKALQDYQKLLKLAPKNFSLLWEKAKMHLQLSQYKQAEKTCQKILHFRSSFAPAHKLLGDLYAQHIANDEKALLHYQYYLELKGKEKGAVKAKIKEILDQKKAQGSSYTDIYIEKDGRKIKVRYYSDGRVERSPVFE